MSKKKKLTNARIFLNSIPNNVERPDILRERKDGLISVGDGVLFDWQKGVYGGVLGLSVVIDKDQMIFSFGAIKESSYGTMNFSVISVDILIKILTEYFGNDK